MRLALTVLAAAILVGCSGEIAPPTAPTSHLPPAPSASISMMVAEDSGLCIQGATVQVVAGQAVGRSETQTEPCDVWGSGGGITFKGLQPGVKMTVRASASGYDPQEKVLVPTQTGVIFTLSRTP